MPSACESCWQVADVRKNDGSQTYALFLVAIDSLPGTKPDLSGCFGETAHAAYSNSYDMRTSTPKQNCISVGVAQGVRGGLIGFAFGAVQTAVAGVSDPRVIGYAGARSAAGFASVCDTSWMTCVADVHVFKSLF
jgi:hypothetical protein